MTENRKRNRLLQRYHKESEHFLNRIITGDETCIHHYNPASKYLSTQWQHPASPSSKKFKTRPVAEKG
jgi:hypothetical protein